MKAVLPAYRSASQVTLGGWGTAIPPFRGAEGGKHVSI